jgi:hypothetical protein
MTVSSVLGRSNKAQLDCRILLVKGREETRPISQMNGICRLDLSVREYRARSEPVKVRI